MPSTRGQFGDALVPGDLDEFFLAFDGSSRRKDSVLVLTVWSTTTL